MGKPQGAPSNPINLANGRATYPADPKIREE